MGGGGGGGKDGGGRGGEGGKGGRGKLGRSGVKTRDWMEVFGRSTERESLRSCCCGGVSGDDHQPLRARTAESA